MLLTMSKRQRHNKEILILAGESHSISPAAYKMLQVLIDSPCKCKIQGNAFQMLYGCKPENVFSQICYTCAKVI